jgi:hypothetical protein
VSRLFRSALPPRIQERAPKRTHVS